MDLQSQYEQLIQDVTFLEVDIDSIEHYISDREEKIKHADIFDFSYKSKMKKEINDLKNTLKEKKEQLFSKKDELKILSEQLKEYALTNESTNTNDEGGPKM